MIYNINRTTIIEWIKKYDRKDLDKLVLDSYLEVSATKMGYKGIDEKNKT